jgi:transcriptional regulator with XRE-family HTH domain
MEFKDRIKTLREKRGLTQYQLADQLFVSRSTVAKWEQGRGLPAKDTLKELADFFCVSSEEILSRDELADQASQSSYRARFWKRFGLIFLGAAIVLGGSWAGVAIAKKIEKDRAYESYQENGFYSPEYLASYHLENLLAPQSDASAPSLFRHNELNLAMGKKTDADNYARYLYKTLRDNPYICYLSFAVELPGVIESPTLAYIPYELFPVEDFHDCISYNGGQELQIYEFYFFTSLDSNRQTGSLVHPSRLSFSWSSSFGSYPNPEKQSSYFVNASLHLSTVPPNSGERYTLGPEISKLTRLTLDSANYTAYFKGVFEADSYGNSLTFSWVYADGLKEKISRIHLPYTLSVSSGSEVGIYPHQSQWAGDFETNGSPSLALELPEKDVFVRLDSVRFSDDNYITFIE